MTEFFRLLGGTVVLRPYVFIFLAVYLALAHAKLGWKRTALFTLTAYLIALACEWSSAVAQTGFPFGIYRYVATTRDRELWVAGVPLMDSLSFAFLSYVSWEVATLLLGPSGARGTEARVGQGERLGRTWKAALLASYLMMMLDLVIDPIALRGDRWFLGKIHEYPGGGIYFGVTVANFAGWLFVCLAILRTYLLLERLIFGAQPQRVRDFPFRVAGPLGLYFGVLGFNLAMTFWIGELLLGLIGVFLASTIAVMVAVAFHGARTPVSSRPSSEID
jgi:putative membrane protein